MDMRVLVGLLPPKKAVGYYLVVKTAKDPLPLVDNPLHHPSIFCVPRGAARYQSVEPRNDFSVVALFAS